MLPGRQCPPHSFHNRLSLLWLMSRVNAALPSLSVMSSLPCSAVAASASHILVDQRFCLSLLQQCGCCWQSSLLRAWGPGQQDTVGLEMVGAAWGWVMVCSICRFAALQVCHCPLVLGRLDACAWLQWGYLPALHHCLLKWIAGKGWWCFWRDGLSFRPYFFLLMVVIAGSFLSRSTHTHTHA